VTEFLAFQPLRDSKERNTTGIDEKWAAYDLMRIDTPGTESGDSTYEGGRTRMTEDAALLLDA
jgi:hypothetical protein